MVKHESTLPDLTGRKRGWMDVGVLFNHSQPPPSLLLDLAKKNCWRLLSLHPYHSSVPRGIDLRGLLTNEMPDHYIVAAMRERQVPIVRIGKAPHPKDHLLHAVLGDRPAVGRLAAEHFSERGFKHAAFVCRSPWGGAKPIYDAFEAHARALDMECHLLQYVSQSEPGTPADKMLQDLQEEFTAWVLQLPRPLALLCASPFIAERQARWAMEAGLHIPEDVAVLCVAENALICECAQVPLSAIDTDDEDRLKAGVNLLGKLMAGGPAPPDNKIFVPPRSVVVRESTDILASSSPPVKRALRYMWDRVAEDLSVDEIATAVQVPRRTLEKAFRRHLGRGINQEFQRRRLEKARDLILESNQAIKDIAAAMSFNSQTQFGRAFRMAYGMSPAQYRRKQGRK